MCYEEFINEFAMILEVPSEMITDEFNMEKDAAWDSLAFISTIALVDKYYGMVLDGEVLKKISTFGELKLLLIKKVA